MNSVYEKCGCVLFYDVKGDFIIRHRCPAHKMIDEVEIEVGN